MRKKTKNKKNHWLTTPPDQKNINVLTNLIREELKALRESLWLKFCNSIDKTNKNSSEYWKKIKQISRLEPSIHFGNRKANNIKELHYNNKTASTDAEKAIVFGETLSKIFSEDPNPSFDNNHKIFVEKYIKENENNLFNTKEEDKFLEDEFFM